MCCIVWHGLNIKFLYLRLKSINTQDSYLERYSAAQAYVYHAPFKVNSQREAPPHLFLEYISDSVTPHILNGKHHHYIDIEICPYMMYTTIPCQHVKTC